MSLWRVTTDPKAGTYTHTVPRGFGHALLSHVVASAFQGLRISASLSNGDLWWSIHSEPDLIPFEDEHGADTERGAHNARMFAEARHRRKTVRAAHGGYWDVCAPVVVRGRVIGFLVSGPFAAERLTAHGVLERWRALTGRQGHPADPEFASYLSSALGTLVLEGRRALEFTELVDCLARLIAGEERSDTLANRADALRVELEKVRFVELTWRAVREMIDERSVRTWQSVSHGYNLRRLGLSRAADHALVGLTVSKNPGVDPVDEAVRREAFQRAAVDLARSVGDAVAGQVGEHGVVFLVTAAGSLERKRKKIDDLADRARALARRFDLTAHFGASVVQRSASLSRSYRGALGAAEAALIQGRRLVMADAIERPNIDSLRHLRQELGTAVEDQPQLLVARFERYLEAVALGRGYRIEAVRGDLDAGFERLADAVASRNHLYRKDLAALYEALDRAAGAANTTNDLLGAYRRAMVDLADAINRPLPARHDRSLRLALDYVEQHYTEDLDAKTVARVAGFAPSYFSKLFRAREKITFSAYVCSLRVERAKQLLATTELPATRIAELSGFRSSHYFSRVFRRSTGVTPLDYRRAPGRGRRGPDGKKVHKQTR